jgi:hypothetical protein
LKIKTISEKSEDININAMCMTFPDEEANNFYMGGEDGSFYAGQVHAK